MTTETIADLMIAVGRLPAWFLIVMFYAYPLARLALVLTCAVLYWFCAAISLVAEAAFNLGKRSSAPARNDGDTAW